MDSIVVSFPYIDMQSCSHVQTSYTLNSYVRKLPTFYIKKQETKCNMKYDQLKNVTMYNRVRYKSAMIQPPRPI